MPSTSLKRGHWWFSPLRKELGISMDVSEAIVQASQPQNRVGGHSKTCFRTFVMDILALGFMAFSMIGK